MKIIFVLRVFHGMVVILVQVVLKLFGIRFAYQKKKGV